MGCAPSTPSIDIPLTAPSQPFLATADGIAAGTFTILRLKPRSFSSIVDVFDEKTNQLLFQLNSGTLRVTHKLQTLSGAELESNKRPELPGAARVDADIPVELETYRIVNDAHVFQPSVLYAEFQDWSSGDECRLTIGDGIGDFAVIVYFERDRKKLPKVDNRDDRTDSRFQAVGRIRQAMGQMPGSKEYVLEATPGVDLSMVLRLWLVGYGIQSRPPTSP